MSDVPAPTTLPCGCFIRAEIVDGVNTLFFSPCSPDCQNLHFALNLAYEKDTGVSYRHS